jgi:hypothetical protein
MSDLEQRVARLERQIAWMYQLVDRDKNQWVRFCLENDFTPEQSQKIAEVFDAAHVALETNKPLTAADFERQLLAHIPQNEKPLGHAYSFIRGLFIALAVDGCRWQDVVRHYGSEWHIPPLGQLRRKNWRTNRFND